VNPVQSSSEIHERPDSNLVERFLVAFNQIHQYCRDRTGASEGVSFVYVVTDFLHRYPRRVDIELLRSFAEIRNILVHQKTRLHRELAMPTPETVELIESISDRFTSPERVEARFCKVVQTIDAEATLLEAMRLIRRTDYTQFPVYQGREFAGLLTSHGITHWLSQVDLEQQPCTILKQTRVQDVLSFEQERLDRNCRFVARDTAVDEILALFQTQPDLEAVLVTEHGRKTEKPLGIVTQWDILEAI
jgi:predicted transcriptional regulator